MMMGFGGLGLLLFWATLIGLAVWAAGTLFPAVICQTEPSNRTLTAQQILNVRYARGDLTCEQYELMQQDLNE